MNKLKDHIRAISATKKLIKDATTINHPENRAKAINIIFRGRQLQHDQIMLAKREYPEFNWASLI